MTDPAAEAEFVAITQATPDTARAALASSGGDVAAAVNTFYAGGGNGGGGPALAGAGGGGGPAAGAWADEGECCAPGREGRRLPERAGVRDARKNRAWGARHASIGHPDQPTSHAWETGRTHGAPPPLAAHAIPPPD